MKNHHEVGHFKNRLMIVLLSLIAILVMAGQSFAATTCSSCHGMPPLDSADGSRLPSTGAFKGSHQKHMGATAAPGECTKCHGNANYNSTHAATNSYMIQMKSNINSSPATGTYSRTAPFPQSSVQNPTLGNCSNVNCHFEKNTTDRQPAPVWGNTTPAVDCNFCHASQPGTANHSKHLASVAYGATMTCTSCHPNYGATNFSHATSAGKHRIVVNTILNYAGGTSISWLPSQSTAYGSCSNVYCHSNGKGVYPTSNPIWGGNPSTGCNFCHPNLSAGHSAHIGTLLTEISFYNYTSTKSVGTVYKFGCANCHPFTVSSHIDGSVDVDVTQNSAGGHLRALNVGGSINGSKQCLNVYCHSNGYKPGATYTYATTPAWGTAFTGDKCAACHGNSPNSTIVGSSAHAAHAVGIHYDDIFNGVSKKLIISGGNTVNAAHGRNNRSTTISCNICHYATVTSSANDKNTLCSGCHDGASPPGGFKNLVYPLTVNTANHVNGKVDVAFIDQKITTKAQVASSAFAGYTGANAGGWSRHSNGMPFKTYTSSYDVTKANLSAVASWSQVSGCSNVACHANIPIAWNAVGVTCTNCHTRLK